MAQTMAKVSSFPLNSYLVVFKDKGTWMVDTTGPMSRVLSSKGNLKKISVWEDDIVVQGVNYPHRKYAVVIQ